MFYTLLVKNLYGIDRVMSYSTSDSFPYTIVLDNEPTIGQYVVDGNLVAHEDYDTVIVPIIAELHAPEKVSGDFVFPDESSLPDPNPAPPPEDIVSPADEAEQEPDGYVPDAAEAPPVLKPATPETLSLLLEELAAINLIIAKASDESNFDLENNIFYLDVDPSTGMEYNPPKELAYTTDPSRPLSNRAEFLAALNGTKTGKEEEIAEIRSRMQ
jgi:hypothetical protein